MGLERGDLWAPPLKGRSDALEAPRYEAVRAPRSSGNWSDWSYWPAWSYGLVLLAGLVLSDWSYWSDWSYSYWSYWPYWPYWLNHFRSVIKTASRNNTPRAHTSCLPSLDQAKPAIRLSLKSVTCFGGPPSID